MIGSILLLPRKRLDGFIVSKRELAPGRLFFRARRSGDLNVPRRRVYAWSVRELTTQRRSGNEFVSRRFDATWRRCQAARVRGMADSPPVRARHPSACKAHRHVPRGAREAARRDSSGTREGRLPEEVIQRKTPRHLCAEGFPFQSQQSKFLRPRLLQRYSQYVPENAKEQVEPRKADRPGNCCRAVAQSLRGVLARMTQNKK